MFLWAFKEDNILLQLFYIWQKFYYYIDSFIVFEIDVFILFLVINFKRNSIIILKKYYLG